MRDEGMEILADVHNLAVVGIIEVLKHYRIFRHVMNQLLAEIQKRKPIAVIGVDYPGFNLRFLQKIHCLLQANTVHQNTANRTLIHLSPKLVQYISPQLWAWNEQRKWGMAEYLDLVLCIFPFEPSIYQVTKLKAVFVGHPLINTTFYPEESRKSNLIALFPGSREKEIYAHMPVLAKLEAQMKATRSTLQIAYACATSKNASIIRSFAPHAQLEIPSLLLNSATVGVVCSGTATLEAALAGLPMCVIYRVAWPTYWLGRLLIKVPFLAMPNLLLKRSLVREFIQSDFTVTKISQEVMSLLDHATYRASIRQGYQEVHTQLAREGDGKAADKAATEILKLIQSENRR